MVEKLPNLPSSIEDAIINKNLVIFIGAGVSRLIGCDGWAQLANLLINKCFYSKNDDGSSYINFKEKETLSKNTDYKKVISICHGILKLHNQEDEFFRTLRNSLKKDTELEESYNVYKELYNLLHDGFSGINGLFLTTNADEHFDTEFSHDEIVFNPDDFDLSNNHLKLYHLHGSISDENSLVFTVDQYIDRYNHPNFYKVLKSIFDEKRVLFIGYGLDEFEIIDFMITKLNIIKNLDEGGELKHFILLPYFSGEDNIMKFDQVYYRNLGINVLGYEKDENGYHQLYYVLKKWNEQISNIRTRLFDPEDEVDEVVDAYERS